MLRGCCRNIFTFAFLFKHFSKYLMCAGLSLLALSESIPQRQVNTSLSISGTVSDGCLDEGDEEGAICLKAAGIQVGGNTI